MGFECNVIKGVLQIPKKLQDKSLTIRCSLVSSLGHKPGLEVLNFIFETS